MTRFLPIALALLAAGCGGPSDEPELNAVVGEPLVVDLGGEVDPSAVLPAGSSITGGIFQWTPDAEQEGEHVIDAGVRKDGSLETVQLHILVAGADAGPISYGGCECGSRPKPPKPGAEAAGAIGVLAWFGARRKRARRQ